MKVPATFTKSEGFSIMIANPLFRVALSSIVLVAVGVCPVFAQGQSDKSQQPGAQQPATVENGKPASTDKINPPAIIKGDAPTEKAGPASTEKINPPAIIKGNAASSENGNYTSEPTSEEMEKMGKAHQQAFENNPDLKKEEDDLVQQSQELKKMGSSASPDDVKAMVKSAKLYEQKLRTAMILSDPTLAPIFAKQDKQKAQKQQNGRTGGSVIYDPNSTRGQTSVDSGSNP
jgi:hypothetical protein